MFLAGKKVLWRKNCTLQNEKGNYSPKQLKLSKHPYIYPLAHTSSINTARASLPSFLHYVRIPLGRMAGEETTVTPFCHQHGDKELLTSPFGCSAGSALTQHCFPKMLESGPDLL